MDTEQQIRHFGFNQDASCLGFALSDGFIVKDSSNLSNRFGRSMSQPILSIISIEIWLILLLIDLEFEFGLKLIAMLGRSNIVAFVGDGENYNFSEKKLIIWDDAQAEIIAELVFRTKILNVKMTREL